MENLQKNVLKKQAVFCTQPAEIFLGILEFWNQSNTTTTTTIYIIYYYI